MIHMNMVVLSTLVRVELAMTGAVALAMVRVLDEVLVMATALVMAPVVAPVMVVETDGSGDG
jgi:hypothetical protein